MTGMLSDPPGVPLGTSFSRMLLLPEPPCSSSFPLFLLVELSPWYGVFHSCYLLQNIKYGWLCPVFSLSCCGFLYPGVLEMSSNSDNSASFSASGAWNTNWILWLSHKVSGVLLLKSSSEIMNDYRLSRQGLERPVSRMGWDFIWA